MKKLIAYILGISLIAEGYCLYKEHGYNKNTELDKNTGLRIGTIKLETTSPTPTYEPTYIVHNLDGTINFKIDSNYLSELSPSATPKTVIVNNNTDKSIDFKIK